ncbi:hypothetical protein C1I98_30895, partial [Spongiactinospora gelatinilytica]
MAGVLGVEDLDPLHAGESFVRAAAGGRVTGRDGLEIVAGAQCVGGQGRRGGHARRAAVVA